MLPSFQLYIDNGSLLANAVPIPPKKKSLEFSGGTEGSRQLTQPNSLTLQTPGTCPQFRLKIQGLLCPQADRSFHQISALHRR